MITAQEARAIIAKGDSIRFAAIWQKIEDAVTKAINAGQESVNVYVSPTVADRAVIDGRLRDLGYKHKYNIYTSMRSEDNSEYYAISW